MSDERGATGVARPMTTLYPVAPTAGPIGIGAAATLPVTEVARELGVSPAAGLAREEVERRQARWGLNAVSSHRARPLPVLWHQLRSPLLGLLVAAAMLSYFVGESGSAVIIGTIVALSVALGFVNEYRRRRRARPCTRTSTTGSSSSATGGRPRWTSPGWYPATSSNSGSATSSRPTSA
jgi:magnesium-transporting ATPase (P-type)